MKNRTYRQRALPTKKTFKQKVMIVVAVLGFIAILGALERNAESMSNSSNPTESAKPISTVASISPKPSTAAVESSSPSISAEPIQTGVVVDPVEATPAAPVKPTQSTPKPGEVDTGGHKTIEVYGGDQSGYREPNVRVDIGFGDREYWAYTNEHGQLFYVEAAEIILQDDNNEPVTSSGRYYSDEAKVPGVEAADLDEGHVIADSLGGVSNAYNITPQNSTLNRHGDQAYMEKVIREAGGCTDFTAIITYPNTETQIPSHYYYRYNLRGTVIEDSFDNVDPDEANASAGFPWQDPSEPMTTPKPANTPDVALAGTSGSGSGDISKIDTNGNGTVTIAEAKAAGFKMPIKSSHWLYKYMIDRDGDGQVGE